MTTKHNEALDNYKFYLTFKNMFCKEYVSEKVFKLFADDVITIPVVRGYGSYKEFLSHHSYIHTSLIFSLHLRWPTTLRS